MTGIVAQELLEVKSKIPDEYLSGFSFFQEDAQKDFSEITERELAILIGCWPRSAGRFVHELWRIGRMEVVYNFFVLPDNYRPEEIREEDIIFGAAVMMKTGSVHYKELRAYITDFSNASQNAHDGQKFGEEPIQPDVVRERVQRVMTGIVELVPNLPQ